MNNFKFVKLLQDAQIVRLTDRLSSQSLSSKKNNPTLPVKEADILFKTMLKERNSKSSKSSYRDFGRNVRVANWLSFKKFLRLLVRLAGKLYPTLRPPRAAFEKMFNDKFYRNILLENERIAEQRGLASEREGSPGRGDYGEDSLSKQSGGERHARVASEKIGLNKLYMDNLCHYLKDDKLIRFLECLHQTVFPLFQQYCRSDNSMDYSRFLRFFKDFQVFPDLVTNVSIISVLSLRLLNSKHLECFRFLLFT